MKQDIQEHLEHCFESLGFSRDPDGTFRMWSDGGDICCCAAVRWIRSGRNVVVELGLVSPAVLRLIGFPDSVHVQPGHGESAGFQFRLGNGDSSVNDGWPVDENNATDVADSVCRALKEQLPYILSNRMSLSGWKQSLRGQLAQQNRGRAALWTLLGYTTLVDPSSSVTEMASVLAAHANEDSTPKFMNRAMNHIARQHELAAIRFGASLPKLDIH